MRECYSRLSRERKSYSDDFRVITGMCTRMNHYRVRISRVRWRRSFSVPVIELSWIRCVRAACCMCVCATSRRRRRRRRRWHRVCETHENTFAEIIWWRAKIGTGWDPRGRSSSASRKLTTKEIREIQEEVPRLKNPEYFPERERRIGERFSEGFSETDGRFVLSSPSLCLFLDPRETRVPPSSRLGGDCVGYCPGANTRRMTIKKILERTHRDESMNTRRTRLSSDFLVELLAKCLSRMNKLN